jgi:hypothetical protein
MFSPLYYSTLGYDEELINYFSRNLSLFPFGNYARNSANPSSRTTETSLASKIGFYHAAKMPGILEAYGDCVALFDC